MELQLIDGNDIELSKDCEFVLPEYMVRLAPEAISSDADVENTIIAAGSDPADGKITVITLGGKVMVLDARSFYIPDGPAIPTNGGAEIFLENVSGRWPGVASGFYIDSRWVIEKSVSALTGAVVKINYPHENQPK
jgi:hypothetical protein